MRGDVLACVHRVRLVGRSTGANARYSSSGTTCATGTASGSPSCRCVVGGGEGEGEVARPPLGKDAGKAREREGGRGRLGTGMGKAMGRERGRLGKGHGGSWGRGGENLGAFQRVRICEFGKIYSFYNILIDKIISDKVLHVKVTRI